MREDLERKCPPFWQRGWFWLGLILLVVAVPLSIARRLMENSHQKALLLTQRKSMPPKGSGNGGTSVSTQIGETSSHGIPVTDLPLVGAYFGNDPMAREALEKQLKELDALVMVTRTADCWVDGTWSFRLLLAKLGHEVPKSMTEADAAANFLKLTNGFSALFAQWREAVAKGEWDFGAAATAKDAQNIPQFLTKVAFPIQQLLGVIAEARMRTGDTNGSWTELQTMKSTTDAFNGSLSYLSWYPRRQLIQTAQLGMELDSWSVDQLAAISAMMAEENALATARRQVELRQVAIADHLSSFHDNQKSIQEDLSRSKSPVGRMMSQVGFTLTSDQQIEDNIAVIQYQMELPLKRFDSVTGYYLGDSADEAAVQPHSKASDVSFDKFYYMYTEEYGGTFDFVVRDVIHEQSTIDQTRIAAALEMRRRATGQYPESLDALGGSIPRDIATGQPYFYQRNADGGYTLWGTGIDRTSEGGDERSDVRYIYRPVKK